MSFPQLVIFKELLAKNLAYFCMVCSVSFKESEETGAQKKKWQTFKKIFTADEQYL